MRYVEKEKFKRVLDALNQTYTHPSENIPRLSILDPQLALTRIYAIQYVHGKERPRLGSEGSNFALLCHGGCRFF